MTVPSVAAPLGPGGYGTATPVRIVVATGASMVLGVLPVFLTGAMATLVEDDLHFSATRLGLALSIFYVASTLSSAAAGRLADRLGARRALATAVTGSTMSLLGIGLVARSWAQLALFLAVGGVANAVGQPATNIALARLVPPHRQGVAFGVKQSSAAGATFIAGAAVPLVSGTLGWRWSFLLAILPAAIHIAAMPPRGQLVRHVAPRPQASAAPTALLVMLAGAVTLAVATASALGSFFVSSAVDQGWSHAAAGTWLAVGSITSMAARVGCGWLADRHSAGLGLIAGLMLTGSVGIVLLGQATTLTILAAATVTSFAAGWGWPGLLQLTAVRQRQHAPGSATGIVLTGMFLGGVYGPATFGFLAERWSYELAWTVAATALATAALLILVGRVAFDRRGGVVG